MKPFLKVFFLTAILSILSFSCQSVHDEPIIHKEDHRFHIIDVTHIKEDLNELFHELTEKQARASLKIIKATTDKDIRHDLITMRRYISKKIKHLDDLDPREELIDTWAFIQRLHFYLETGAGKHLFGEHQLTMLKPLREVDDHIHLLVRKHMDNKKHFLELEKEIDQYVSTHPIVGHFEDPKHDKGHSFTDIMSYPLAPLKAFGAIADTGESMQRISRSIERITDIADTLPEDIRWQLQILTLQLEDSEILKKNTESIEKLVASSERITNVMQAYPKEINKQISILSKDFNQMLDRVDRISKELKTVTASIESSSNNIKSSSQNFERTSVNVSKSTETVVTAIKQVEASSTALGQSAKAISQTIKDIRDMSDHFKSQNTDDTTSKDEMPFLAQVEVSSLALEKGADKINLALSQILELVKTKPLDEKISAFDAASQKTLAQTRDESKNIIQFAFTRMSLLVLLILIASIANQVIKKKLAKAK